MTTVTASSPVTGLPPVTLSLVADISPLQEWGNVENTGTVAGRSPIRRDRIAGQGRSIERRPHRMRRLIVTLDARGERGIGGSKRYASQGHRHGAALGLPEVGPRHALPRHRRAPVVAAVVPEDEAGNRQAVSAVERVVAIAVSAPPPTAQTMDSWSVGSIANFKARRMGTSELRLRKTDPLP